MSLGTLLIAAAVGGGTYAVAKSKNASNGQAALAGAAAGAGTALALPLLLGLLGWFIVLGLVAVPAAGVYYLMKSKEQKALPPGR